MPASVEKRREPRTRNCFDLLRRAEGHARLIPRHDVEALPDLPVIYPRLNIDGRTVRTISTVMRFDTAVEVTASELQVELMFPADDESEAYFRQTAAQQVRIVPGLSDN